MLDGRVLGGWGLGFLRFTFRLLLGPLCPDRVRTGAVVMQCIPVILQPHLWMSPSLQSRVHVAAPPSLSTSGSQSTGGSVSAECAAHVCFQDTSVLAIGRAARLRCQAHGLGSTMFHRRASQKTADEWAPNETQCVSGPASWCGCCGNPSVSLLSGQDTIHNPIHVTHDTMTQ